VPPVVVVLDIVSCRHRGAAPRLGRSTAGRSALRSACRAVRCMVGCPAGLATSAAALG